jgi:hypothetical protein
VLFQNKGFDMIKVAKEFVAMGSEIYQGDVPESAKNHH